MERWEYAFGQEDYRAHPGKKWTADSEPGTYAEAERAMIRALAADDPTSDYSLHSACIVKRSERHSEWAPVHDHAAELLAEVVHDMAYQFSNYGSGIMQGTDLVKTLRKVAQGVKNTLPQNIEEYDS